MNRRCAPALLLVALLVLPLLAACGAPATSQQNLPTPTPLPPAPALERPTYTVKRGAIERALEVVGTITPVDLTRLSFKREGRVATVNVARGDAVTAGTVLAELQQDEKLEELRSAEDAVVQAQRDLESAARQKQKAVEQARLGLAQAQDDLARLLPGGPDDPIRQAQKALEEAQRAAEQEKDSASETKTGTEYELIKATEALQDAQKAYSDAWWDYKWVQDYGTDPSNPYTTDPTTGEKIPNKLSDEEKQQFEEALLSAERALRDAERNVELTQRKLDQTIEDEVYQSSEADEKVQEAQRALDLLLAGGSKEIIAAQRAVTEQRLALEEAQAQTFNSEMKAVDDAKRRLEKAQKAVTDGQLVAEQDGEVLALGITEGDTVEAFAPVIEIADPSQLEVAVELGGEQMRQIAEGQPAEISLLARPDVTMPAIIRRLPAPYGSGGSGAVAEQDRTTRFQVLDAKGQELVAGGKVTVRVVLERKENALLLPPEAIRSFEGRRFVIVRAGDTEQRQTIKIGIETEEAVEVLEGVEAGDVVVGQ